MNSAQSYNSIFGTKADTLSRLAEKLRLPKMCDQVVVPVVKWRDDSAAAIREVLDRFQDTLLVVRSSAASEDGWSGSNAGGHLSVARIIPEADALAAAVESVIASYRERHEDDQVLIQPMVENVALSGVVLTRDLDTGGPYYVVNYDDFSGRTDTVTGGAISKTILVSRRHSGALHSSRFRKLLDVVHEIEEVTACEELDIEFCITADESVYVLQARPMAVRKRWQLTAEADLDKALTDIGSALQAQMAPVRGKLGATTVLGEMPDWNPAEMIGTAPRPLALSLYRYLITDDTWARARARMGYRDMSGEPLLIELAGRPYIDVRSSFNSFLPTGLEDGTAARLIDYQLDRLKEHPELHDKIEFRIAVTCRDFGSRNRYAELVRAGFGTGEIDALDNGLATLTTAALDHSGVGLDGLIAPALRLSDDQRLRPSGIALPGLRKSLDETIRSGTLPFSILARHAFIGVAFLRSMVERGAMVEEDAERFMRGIETVASDVVRHIQMVGTGRMALEKFLGLYGHLRPGTYDILSWRYDERPDLYLGGAALKPEADPAPFQAGPKLIRDVSALLDESGYAMPAERLLAYIAQAVAARERAKFCFTKSLSDILRSLCLWGENVGLAREDISYLTIGSILDHPEEIGRLREEVDRARETHWLTRAIRLPHVITEPDDIYVVRMPLWQPTFITAQSVTAEARALNANEAPDLSGKIVMIESADPGFDWIFSHAIAGLITKFGGSNSHMAIRCAEFGLPAAIGCGDRLFDRLAKGRIIELNCGARTVRPAGRH